MVEPDNLRYTKLPLNNGSGAIPALGFGTLIADPIATRNATKAALWGKHAVLRGLLSYFGTYTVNDTDRSLNFLVERSSFPNQVGAEQKRVITVLTADELKFTNFGRLAGGQNYFAFKRAQ